MSKLKRVLDEVLYENYEEKINEQEDKENNLKLFYNIDILITRSEEKKQAAEGNAPEEGREEEGGEEQEQSQGQVYNHKAQGELTVPQEKAENVQNLENLLNFAANMYEGGEPLINELVVETIKTAAGVGQGAIDQILDENDKMIVDLDYGFSKDDGVGIKINKQSGNEMVSFSMKHDGNIVGQSFNYDTFNQQLLDLRKRLLEG